ncbi:hypothetical protein BDN72DRAFT_896609 [Pluteus cervinus]|uniref:Uncharacterized protein n=1 Tax=Pluteus cervinus TaxID=181527 RepID=A0ACD3AWW9_9AGAR|nr:hypothetical protein BDN72DRAFT_896609 [Pluteus cervinus]
MSCSRIAQRLPIDDKAKANFKPQEGVNMAIQTLFITPETRATGKIPPPQHTPSALELADDCAALSEGLHQRRAAIPYNSVTMDYFNAIRSLDDTILDIRHLALRSTSPTRWPFARVRPNAAKIAQYRQRLDCALGLFNMRLLMLSCSLLDRCHGLHISPSGTFTGLTVDPPTDPGLIMERSEGIDEAAARSGEISSLAVLLFHSQSPQSSIANDQLGTPIIVPRQGAEVTLLCTTTGTMVVTNLAGDCNVSSVSRTVVNTDSRCADEGRSASSGLSESLVIDLDDADGYSSY